MFNVLAMPNQYCLWLEETEAAKALRSSDTLSVAVVIPFLLEIKGHLQYQLYLLRNIFSHWHGSLFALIKPPAENDFA